uniref:Uncharacterized protein n=1 Tax=Oreochromis niloticus TaxID=8128 RepID=A0A669EMV1_ORENI
AHLRKSIVEVSVTYKQLKTSLISSTLDNNGMNGRDPRTLLLSEKDTAACLQFAENHMDKPEVSHETSTLEVLPKNSQKNY